MGPREAMICHRSLGNQQQSWKELRPTSRFTFYHQLNKRLEFRFSRLLPLDLLIGGREAMSKIKEARKSLGNSEPGKES